VTIERRNFPQFFITAPSPCPYLPGRLERKVFTHLVGHEAKTLNTSLSNGGFRRSQNIAYRAACDSCHACVSVRIPVEEFNWSRSFTRIKRKNADLKSTVEKAAATSEHYTLFRDYIDTRHGEGGMADMSVLDFAAMIDETVVECRIVEYRLNASSVNKGNLCAAALIDVLDDGLSLIYSFYDPSHANRSLGTHMILDAITRAKNMRLPYVYLGYLINNSSKMAYKARFLPQQRLTNEGWLLYST
jgi:leucyl-tRNA---protein transferase